METAYSEGGADPAKMVRLLLLDSDELTAALGHLVKTGLMSEGDGRFLLTAEGSARVDSRRARESTELKRATPIWQSR
jgi:hypothetical protein